MHPHLWYPYTQAKTAPEPLKVKSAQGAWLELQDGSRLLDCISSWWVNLHGHAHPHMAAAIYRQAKQLEHVIFAGFTHDPAEQLAEQLVNLLPAPLSRVFFSDNGSTAVEVALKMAYQYWQNQGQSRQKFLAFEGAYHGDTVGAMAVGARSLFSQVFADLLFEVEFVPFPDTDLSDTEAESREAQAIEAIAQKLQTHAYAGIIIEPLVQGAGGMRMCRPAFLQKLRHLTQQFETLLIADEVMTGFGRTGDWFACTKAAIAPDIICLSKGLTGGFLPMAGHRLHRHPLPCLLQRRSAENAVSRSQLHRKSARLCGSTGLSRTADREFHCVSKHGGQTSPTPEPLAGASQPQALTGDRHDRRNGYCHD
jgi:adenosylmethionine-8-amino-7-oxononanoate aminotransferase